jgi:hypothetical protein
MQIWAVWSKEVMGYLKLFYKKSSNLGVTWSEEANLTDLLVEGQDQNPSIMQAENGTIWVVWASDRTPPHPPTPDFYLDASPRNLTVSRGESGNSTIIVTSVNGFSESVSLTVLNVPTGVTALFEPSQVTPLPNQTANSTLTLSVDPAATPGNYTITVIGSSDHLMHIINVYLEIVVFGGTGQTSIEVTSSLNAAESPIEDYEIYYKTSHNNGVTWSPDLQLTNNSVDDLKPAIVQLANGTVMIVYQSYLSGSHEICYKTTNDGITWSNVIQLTSDPAHDKGPSATQTQDGRIWAVWTSTRTGDYEIFYKIFNGSSWTSDTRLTFSIYSDVQPAVLQATNGDIFIFWASDAHGTHDIYYVNSTDNGVTWSPPMLFVEGSYEDLWPTLMQAADTKIWVAWGSDEADQPDGNWDIYIKTSLAGDVNGDGITNIADLSIVSLVYGATESKPNYNPDADLNRDGIVDIRDVRIVARYFMET